MTLACVDTNSKLVEVVPVADVEDRVANSLLQIWMLRFGQKDQVLLRFEAGVSSVFAADVL